MEPSQCIFLPLRAPTAQHNETAQVITVSSTTGGRDGNKKTHYEVQQALFKVLSLCAPCTYSTTLWHHSTFWLPRVADKWWCYTTASVNQWNPRGQIGTWNVLVSLFSAVSKVMGKLEPVEARAGESQWTTLLILYYNHCLFNVKHVMAILIVFFVTSNKLLQSAADTLHGVAELWQHCVVWENRALQRIIPMRNNGAFH